MNNWREVTGQLVPGQLVPGHFVPGQLVPRTFGTRSLTRTIGTLDATFRFLNTDNWYNRGHVPLLELGQLVLGTYRSRC